MLTLLGKPSVVELEFGLFLIRKNGGLIQTYGGGFGCVGFLDRKVGGVGGGGGSYFGGG